MIVLGLYDKANSMYDKFFMIREDERNNFIKSLKIIVNNGTDVLSVYSDDYYLTEIAILNNSGLEKIDRPIKIELSSLKEAK